MRIKIDTNTNWQDNCFLRGLVQNSRRGEREARGKEKKNSRANHLFFIYIYIYEKNELTLIEIDYNNKIMTKY